MAKMKVIPMRRCLTGKKTETAQLEISLNGGGLQRSSGPSRRKVAPQNPVARWEAALRGRHVAPSSDEWRRIYRQADPEGYSNWGPEDAEANAVWDFQDAVRRHRVGGIAIDFPHSTHGDGISVDVYLLPKGTTVIVSSSTYERESLTSPTRIYRGRRCEAMLALANQLLYTGDDGDWGTIQDLDENPEYDSDANATIEGEMELRRNWTAAIRRKITPGRPGPRVASPN